MEKAELSEEKISSIEKPLVEEILVDYSISIDEFLELHYKEEVLLKEQERRYPNWNELSDQRLIESLLELREDERRYIY